MDHDPTKRGYLLPQGCKDLVDVLKFEQREGCNVLINLLGQGANRESAAQLVGELVIREPVTVQELATLLGQHPSRVIVDLLGFGVYSSVTTEIGFAAAKKVVRKYGYKAKRLA